MYSRNTKTTNEPTASNNKSDRPQVKIWETWKTVKYLNINDSFHLKDLEISKYKRESKARMPIKFCCLIFVNCGFLNHRRSWHGPPPVLFTHLFSIKFLYFYIISSLFLILTCSSLRGHIFFTLLVFRKPNKTTINKFLSVNVLSILVYI